MLLQYLKKVGVGKKRFKDLTKEEAYQAEKIIANGGATDIQIGAFWSAERIKYASIDELKGFIDVYREELKPVETDVKPLDLAVNYDGKDRSIHILPASIFIASACGVYLGGHGAENVPSKYGTTYHQVLEKMGAKTPDSIDTVKETLEKTGFGFVHQRLFAQKLFNLMDKRREFGLRTYHNTMERMLNPYNTDKVITGVSHPPYIEKYIALGRYVGMERITVFKGLEGGIEPFPNQGTDVFIEDKKGGRFVAVDPEGVDKTLVLRKVSLEENAQICLDILRHKGEEGVVMFALLSSALLLMGYGKTEDLDEALFTSYQALKSGEAYKKFQQYAEITNSKTP